MFAAYVPPIALYVWVLNCARPARILSFSTRHLRYILLRGSAFWRLIVQEVHMVTVRQRHAHRAFMTVGPVPMELTALPATKLFTTELLTLIFQSAFLYPDSTMPVYPLPAPVCYPALNAPQLLSVRPATS